jgi:hypothetical protein
VELSCLRYRSPRRPCARSRSAPSPHVRSIGSGRGTGRWANSPFWKAIPAWANRLSRWISAPGSAPDGAPGREAEALDRAAAFLAAVLADGPLAVRDVWTAAQAQGLSRRTLGRAKEELGVRSVWIRVEGQPVCHGAISRAEPLPTPSEDDETSLEPWLAPLREKYPGPTPLDDL